MASYRIALEDITHLILVRDFAALAAPVLHLLLFRSHFYNRLDLFLVVIDLLFIPNASSEFHK